VDRLRGLLTADAFLPSISVLALSFRTFIFLVFIFGCGCVSCRNSRQSASCVVSYRIVIVGAESAAMRLVCPWCGGAYALVHPDSGLSTARQGCSHKKRKWGTPETRLRQKNLNNLSLHTRTLIHVRKIATADLWSCPAIQLLVFECL